VGPSEYDIFASDMHLLNAGRPNIGLFVKFADDTYLIWDAATYHHQRRNRGYPPLGD